SKNLTKSDLNIYPNPANNVISISNLDNFDFLQIKDLLGKVVCKKSISKVNNTTIDVQGFSTGTYLLNLEGSFTSISRKIVIE
ncbi:T9SS type A sorting domain-containing protein, partial [Bacteroidota bacterium]|nr:T9SS type A sorting domain-containing protein [Bacteroidota bacterium]